MCATFSHTAYLINSYYLCIKDFFADENTFNIHHIRLCRFELLRPDRKREHRHRVGYRHRIYLHQLEVDCESRPCGSLLRSYHYFNNELETEIFTSDPESQQVVDNQAIAVCVGDTLWLANTNYLNQAFNNKCEWFLNYMPLYFTEKIAFVKFWNSYPSEYYMRLMPNKKLETLFTYDCQSSFYILDFIGKRLVELNYKVLTSLLERYPDLQCRYLGMKKYKTKDVVDFFFMQYIERLKTDDDALTILEQLNQQNK